MSVAPVHTARPPPGGVRLTFPVSRRPHHAADSSRVQVVVLAAARLRALHLDPLITDSGRKTRRPTTKGRNNSLSSCPGPRLHRETATETAGPVLPDGVSPG
jgi:hypothetical protein